MRRPQSGVVWLRRSAITRTNMTTAANPASPWLFPGQLPANIAATASSASFTNWASPPGKPWPPGANSSVTHHPRSSPTRSVLSLQRSLEIGSYQTVWAMLGRLRSVLVRPGRDRLAGRVEVDETYIGGEEPGLRGGRARGKKVLTGIAVEVREPKGIGRCRMALLADGSSASLHPFVTGHVEPGATVITDAWMGYHGLAGLGYAHQRRSQRAARARGDDPGELLPAVHRVASLAKRRLLSTHQGSVEEAHLQSYLDEFVFRFNRRRSRSRGLVFYRLLELAVGHDPVAVPQHRRRQTATEDPADPPARRGHPPSLEAPPAERPWRAADLDSSG